MTTDGRRHARRASCAIAKRQGRLRSDGAGGNPDRRQAFRCSAPASPTTWRRRRCSRAAPLQSRRVRRAPRPLETLRLLRVRAGCSRQLDCLADHRLIAYMIGEDQHQTCVEVAALSLAQAAMDSDDRVVDGVGVGEVGLARSAGMAPSQTAAVARRAAAARRDGSGRRQRAATCWSGRNR